MRKSLSKIVLSGVFVALAATSVHAGQTLEEQVQALSRQNRAQSKLLQELQHRIEYGADVSHEDDPGGLLQAINNHVNLSALVEVEGNSAKDFDNSKSSDFTLAMVEIGLDADVSEWSSAHILLKYEEGDDDHVFIDEGICKSSWLSRSCRSDKVTK